MGLLFSIIIPVHNSEKYLSESLKSVLGQTYSKKKYEIIIVDDYSTDGSEKIIKNFKRKFKNIKVVNNKMNKKVSYSRNIGIKNAKGRYIVFLDSDDQLKKYSLSNIESILQRKEHDLILCLEFKSNKWKINPSKVKQLKDVNSFIDYENKKNFYNPNCWNMIIKRSFLLRKKILFKKIDIFEDQVFCIEVLLNADLLKIIPGTFYNYIQRPFSLSRKTNILALNSCLHALINFYYLTKKFNLTKNRIVFVKKRINFILNNINKYIASSSLLQIKKISNEYKKFSKKINIKDKIFYNNFFSFRNMSSIKKRITLKVINYDYSNYDKIFIFGFGVSGRTIFHILENQNMKIDGFIDNDKNFMNSEYFKKRIINPEYLTLINVKRHNVLVIISQTEKSISKAMTKQLIEHGLKKKNIKIMNIS